MRRRKFSFDWSAAVVVGVLTLIVLLLWGCDQSPTEPHGLTVVVGTPAPCVVSPWTDCLNPSPWPTPTPGIAPTSTPPAWIPTWPAGRPTPTYAPWPTGVPTPPPQDGP